MSERQEMIPNTQQVWGGGVAQQGVDEVGRKLPGFGCIGCPGQFGRKPRMIPVSEAEVGNEWPTDHISLWKSFVLALPGQSKAKLKIQ